MRDRRSRLVRKLLGLQTENDGVLERIQAAHGEEASQQNPRPGGAATTSGATAHRRSRAHVCSADAPPGPTPSLLQQHGPPGLGLVRRRLRPPQVAVVVVVEADQARMMRLRQARLQPI